jgi:hypothetical protein
VKRSRSAGGSNCPALAIPKTQPRNKQAEDAKAARQRKKVRLATVEAWGLACACRRCGDDWQTLQIHEEPPRSHGGDPLDPLDCLPLSARCHRKRTGDVGIGQPLTIEVASPIWKCRGPLVFRERIDGDVIAWVTVPWSRQRFCLEALPGLIVRVGMERR